MQLMTLNSLLMFDIVFIFFLFLVGVTCLVYYLPPPALSSIRAAAAVAAGSGASAGSHTTLTATCGTTTTCTGETVRFRRYSVGSLLSASDVAVGNHRFHNPLTSDEELVADCEGLEEILSLRGSSPILLHRTSASSLSLAQPPPPPPAPFCACCCVEHHQQRDFQLLQQHLVENPQDLEVEQVTAGATLATAIAGVDYVQIEIERTATDPVPPCCYVRAKDVDVRECHGPIHDV